MKKVRTSIMILLLATGHFAAAAQSKPGFVINGKVTSFEESLPLEGASVVVKGSTNITGTQADGSFSLLLNPGDSLLLVSLAGYEPKEIKASAVSRQYDIVLRRNDKAAATHTPANQIIYYSFSKQTKGNYWPLAH
jgi:hypothetical protein